MNEPPHRAQEAHAAEAFWARRSQNTSVILLVATALVGWVLMPLWKPLTLGVVFAASTADLHRKLTKRLWGRSYLSAGLLTIAGLVLIVGPVVALGSIALRQAVAALEWIRTLAGTGRLRELMRPLPDALERLLRPQVERLPKLLRTLPDGTGEAGRWAAEQVQNVVTTASEVAFDLAMMTIAFFFVLADGERLVGWLKSVSPIGRSRTQELLSDFRVVARSLVGSNLITGIAQSAVATVGYFIVQAPQPVFFGLLTFLTSFMPTVGTAIVSLPLAGLLWLTGKGWGALFLVAWSLGVVGVIDNLLRPLLIRGDVNIHGAVIFFSLLGGIALFGLVGLVAGPMALSLFLAMLRFHARDVRHEVATAGGK